MKKHIRIFALLLAVLMTFTLTGCGTSLDNPSGTSPEASSSGTTTPTSKLPSTGTTGATSPSAPAIDDAAIGTIIARLNESIYEAAANSADTVAFVENYYNDHGFEEYLQLLDSIYQVRTDRISQLSNIIATLEDLDLSNTALVAAKLAEAEVMISEDYHNYGWVLETQQPDGYDCTQRGYYAICTNCNKMVFQGEQHQWYYNRSRETHSLQCQNCSTSGVATAHDMNTQGQCKDCGYLLYANILVIESIAGESAALCGSIDNNHTVTIVHTQDKTNMPKTVEELLAYDEVILCNVANSDMPKGFDKILYSYVHDFGGGLFTVCGNTADSTADDWQANAYTRDDMCGTLYQHMLPVEAINYTPPVAVMILIDVSGSMFVPGEPDAVYEQSKLFWAKQGAEACLDVLSERDYVGVMALADEYTEAIGLTPRTQRDKILQAIEKLHGPGGTIYSLALEKAGQALMAMTGVEKKHIILITDGEPAIEDTERYLYMMQKNAEAGITMSIIGMQCVSAAARNMREALVDYAGMKAEDFHDVTDLTRAPLAMRSVLMTPEIKDTNYLTFIPTIHSSTSPITKDISQEDMPTLDGFYGMKAKEGASVVLMGEYTPIYTQWAYGYGRVGTFACDLNGTWSADFLSSETGVTILNNIVVHLANMPTVQIITPADPDDPLAAIIGKKCPSAQLPLLNVEGVSIDPASLGKITIITFWDSMCHPCADKLNTFSWFAYEYADQITVLAVHTDFHSDNLDADTYLDSDMLYAVDKPSDDSGYFYEALGLRAPCHCTIILDANGVVIYAGTTVFRSMNDIEELLYYLGILN